MGVLDLFSENENLWDFFFLATVCFKFHRHSNNAPQQIECIIIIILTLSQIYASTKRKQTQKG